MSVESTIVLMKVILQTKGCLKKDEWRGAQIDRKGNGRLKATGKSRHRAQTLEQNKDESQRSSE